MNKFELLEKDLKAWEDSAKGFEKLGVNNYGHRETAKRHKDIAYGFRLAINIIKQFPKKKEFLRDRWAQKMDKCVCDNSVLCEGDPDNGCENCKGHIDET